MLIPCPTTSAHWPHRWLLNADIVFHLAGKEATAKAQTTVTTAAAEQSAAQAATDEQPGEQQQSVTRDAAEDVEDDEDDANETCGFCRFMKGGGCRTAFVVSRAEGVMRHRSAW